MIDFRLLKSGDIIQNINYGPTLLILSIKQEINEDEKTYHMKFDVFYNFKLCCYSMTFKELFTYTISEKYEENWFKIND